MSPVTGVLALVVIVMGLTLAIIMVISLMDTDGEPPPEISFSFNETGEYAEVEEHSPALAWDEFQMSMDRSGRFALVGGPVHEVSAALVFLAIDDDRPVQEGDRIHFCIIEGDGPLEVTIRDYRSGAVVDRGVFTYVSPCPERPGQGGNSVT